MLGIYGRIAQPGVNQDQDNAQCIILKKVVLPQFS